MIRKCLLILFFVFGFSAAYSQTHEVLISTNLGSMKFMLYDDTPRHRDAFIELAKSGHFNGTLFYRVINGFMIQGGSKDSRNAPPGKFIGYGDPTKTVDDEILANHFFVKRALCVLLVSPMKSTFLNRAIFLSFSLFRVENIVLGNSILWKLQ